MPPPRPSTSDISTVGIVVVGFGVGVGVEFRVCVFFLLLDGCRACALALLSDEHSGKAFSRSIRRTRTPNHDISFWSERDRSSSRIRSVSSVPPCRTTTTTTKKTNLLMSGFFLVHS